MKDIGMLFKAPMVRGIRAGRKKQTRRVLTVQPTFGPYGWQWPSDKARSMVDMHEAVGLGPYQVGDHLWVRETFSTDALTVYPCPPAWYRADDHDPTNGGEHDRGCTGNQANCFACVLGRPMRWRPAIFMPRRLSRITLEITDVRVQQLQEISEGDAHEEGVSNCSLRRVGYVLGDDDGRCPLYPTARRAFEVGWDGINGKRAPWASNPWVWAITFRGAS